MQPASFLSILHISMHVHHELPVMTRTYWTYLQAAIAIVRYRLGVWPSREQDKVGKALYLQLCMLIGGPIHLCHLRILQPQLTGMHCKGSTDWHILSPQMTAIPACTAS